MTLQPSSFHLVMVPVRHLRGCAGCKGHYPLGSTFFICCPLDGRRLGVLPFEGVIVMTLKIYNGEDSKFQR